MGLYVIFIDLFTVEDAHGAPRGNRSMSHPIELNIGFCMSFVSYVSEVGNQGVSAATNYETPKQIRRESLLNTSR